jgi:hypothetical protein
LAKIAVTRASTASNKRSQVEQVAEI